MAEHMQLSKRLKAIGSFIHQDSSFADIGSDHAYLPCYICIQHPNVQAIAGEVNEGPWNRAKETISHYGLTDRIEVRMGNGLEILTKHDKIDTVVIAGMGGSLITTILTAGIEKLATVDRIIVQPNNHAYVIRRFMALYHYEIIDELIIEENGQIYEIIITDKKQPTDQDITTDVVQKQWLFGPILMEQKSAIFLKKWQAERDKLHRIIQQMKKAKVPDNDKLIRLEKRLTWIKEVLS